MQPSRELIHWIAMLRKAEDSPYGMQLFPQLAGELANLISDYITEVRNMELEHLQGQMASYSTPCCEICALNGGKHEE